MIKFRKLLSVFLSMSILLSLTVGLNFCTYALVNSGSCGENVYYTFDESTGELVISGTGAIKDYGRIDSPFYNNSRIKSVVINSGVTSIGEQAFFHCTSLTSVTIGNSVISIGYGAFDGCSSLKNVVIPDSVTSIGDYTFYGTRLRNITIPNNVISIGEGVFRNCKELTSVTIGNSVTSIDDYAFDGCSSLKNVVIPDSVTSIGEGAFSYCKSLTSVTIGNSVTNIKKWAFHGCESLASITIPDSVMSIGDSAFGYCRNLLSVKIGNGVTSIGENAFNNCTRLTRVNISSIEAWCNITFLDSTANPLCFAQNLYLNGNLFTDLVFPYGVKSIGSYTFYNCKSLTSVTIPDSVTSIGDYAFCDCDNIKTVYYLGTKESWLEIEKNIANNSLDLASVKFHKHSYIITYELGKTCLLDGYIKYSCDCGKEYTEVLIAGHKYFIMDIIESDCENRGIVVYECSICGDTYIEEPEALGHDIVVDKAVPPTCTELGLTEGSHCLRCGTVTVKQEKVESYGGHSFVNYISDKNATCLEDGTKTAKCARCDVINTITDVDSKLGHNYIATVTKPVCTERGYTTYACLRCEEVYISDYTEMLGYHTSKVIDYIAPTCTETGLTEGSYCSVCGIILIGQQTLLAKGHSYEFYRSTATCEKSGYDIYKCSVCSNTKTEKVDSHHICDNFLGINDGALVYSCSSCGNEYAQSFDSVLSKWNFDLTDKELDIVDDGVINAKDYAKLLHLKNYGN